MKYKFKVNDVVKIIKKQEFDENNYFFNKIGIIKKIRRGKDILYPYKVYFFKKEDNFCIFCDEEIELHKPILKKFIEEMESKEDNFCIFCDDEIELHKPILKKFIEEMESKEDNHQ